MSRGMVNGEAIVSQAGTDEFRAGYDRVFGDKKPQRGRWVWDERAGKLVRAEDYRPPARALYAPIIADRIHEGTTLDDGERVVDLGSRRKRREFKRERGLEDATDCSPSWLENRKRETERQNDRRTETAMEKAREKLYLQGKLRD